MHLQLMIEKVKLRIDLYLNYRKNQKWFKEFHHLFENQKGLEIGGPSLIFQEDILNVYELAKTVDGVNFSSNTVWEGEIKDNVYKYAENKTGTQFILDGTDLNQIHDNSYDFLLSSHNLEHIANPLKAVEEWVRVLKKGGALVLILPDKRYTFDINRPYTKFDHILDDFRNNVDEYDLTHIDEILKLHDLRRDNGAPKDIDKFRERCEKNFDNRCLHHHVFSTDLLAEIYNHFDLEILGQKFIEPVHKVIIGRKR
ncbi:methyltransferase domain-containing protein [Chryseobacterium foetidum]|uniref:methyltransferase domain-containing protein n=1 Tax=Chryseobacterium foetidum TaxID=2951057 RepID=UPI0021C9E8B4|nr:methyltransferase domain-containing protein [Chryseobacterium foetidum]